MEPRGGVAGVSQCRELLRLCDYEYHVGHYWRRQRITSVIQGALLLDASHKSKRVARIFCHCC